MPNSPLRRALLILCAVSLALGCFAYWTATRDPIVRRAEVSVPGLARGRSARIVLLSDLHVAGPDMPPERLRRIVEQANGLEPDLVLIAGDFVSDRRLSNHHYTAQEAVAPLAGLRTRLGVFAVLGNHDHWRNANGVRAALKGARVRVLDNQAARAGPFAIGGLDDAFTDHDNLPLTLRRMRQIGGVPVLLSHSPDPFPDVPASVPLVLAGHTHCGQISLPIIGALATASRYGQRYACGLMAENGKTLVVSAGLGTSLLPLRLGAAPDMWLVTVRGR
jgi:predicted MPP superfamily phosphohydrolase